MTTFRITPATSVHTSANADPAFHMDSATADALIVDPGAFLVAEGDDSAGALLAGTGAWSVTIDGAVVSLKSHGIQLAAGNADASTITVGIEGEVSGRTSGIAAASSATIVNKGAILGTTCGVLLSGGESHLIRNSGTIEGINAVLDEAGTSADTVRNSGILTGIVHLGGGDDLLSNTGEINAPLDVRFSLVPQNVVELGEGADVLINAGAIRGGVGDQGGAASVANSGLIVGDVALGTGNDSFVNFRTVRGVVLDGTVQGVIDLGDGEDSFTGGANGETVRDGNGPDTVALGGGDDAYLALGHSGADGTDSIDGGAGTDTYDAHDAESNIWINLDTRAHDLSPYMPGGARVTANRAIGLEVAGAGADRIVNFENASTGLGDDVVYGTSGANEIPPKTRQEAKKRGGGSGERGIFGSKRVRSPRIQGRGAGWRDGRHHSRSRARGAAAHRAAACGAASGEPGAGGREPDAEGLHHRRPSRGGDRARDRAAGAVPGGERRVPREHARAVRGAARAAAAGRAAGRRGARGVLAGLLAALRGAAALRGVTRISRARRCAPVPAAFGVLGHRLFADSAVQKSLTRPLRSQSP